jgi:phospholipid/cholesterol/gamma-HCH transport system substrate-binding protein
MTFSGFPIGEVKRMDLTEDGKVRIEIAVPREDARWLRQNSVFTLEKPLVGGAKIKAHTANLADKPLEGGAKRELITGDATQEIPVLIEKVKTILSNVALMTDADAPINRSLGSVATVTGRMAGEYGVLEGVLGGPEKAHQVVSALEKANTLLASLNGVSLKVDGILAKTDGRVFGQDGVMDQAQQSIARVNSILGEVSASLKKADAILANAQIASADVAGITGNVREATTDMAQLRVEIDDSVRKVNHLINEINRKWPFARDVEIRTP